MLSLGHIDVDSADFWTDRLLSSSSRRTADVSKHSNTRTLKSGWRRDSHAGTVTATTEVFDVRKHAWRRAFGDDAELTRAQHALLATVLRRSS